MTQKIKILDPQEAIKIAAGEVIERPAHIIKELIENSIDAGAKNITLHLEHAGKNLIKITDDGYGMSSVDAKLCFAHHATSKISTVHDLQKILTYGFRGEALSSIASASNVVLITKTAEEKLATSLKLEHAKLLEETQTSHPTGTTLIISNLFENIPARKKFLKTDETEWNFIVTIIQAFALRYPEINFKIFHNDIMAYNCPTTSKLSVRVAQLWNNNLHDQLLELTPTTEQNITISGAISDMHYHRFNRGQIFTFVNNRWVKNSELYKGILKGYDGVLPLQKFPAAFIFVQIDPHEIDINIHPKKEEVKFLHPGTVQRMIETAVKNCLGSQIKEKLNESKEDLRTRSPLEVGDNIFNKKDIFFSLTDNNQILNSSIDKQYLATKKIKLFQDLESIPNTKSTIPLLDKNFQSTYIIPDFERESKSFSDQINTTIYDEEPYSIVGQFKKTYLMVEKSEQLIIIDQHSAHERILYERFKAVTAPAPTVQLLFPHIIKLNSEDMVTLQIYQKILEHHGILFDQFSDHEIIIQATPVEMSSKSAEEILQTILAWTQEHQEMPHEELFKELHEKVLAEKACKAACKAGDTLNHEQMQNLLEQLQTTANNFCCPHGRPTMWCQGLKEIEKHFKRDYAGSKNLLAF